MEDELGEEHNDQNILYVSTYYNTGNIIKFQNNFFFYHNVTSLKF